MKELIDPDTLGHWDGDTFHFDQPFLMIRPSWMVTLDFSMFIPQDETITKQDALHAVVNAVAWEQL